jgi:hypothetical protein
MASRRRFCFITAPIPASRCVVAALLSPPAASAIPVVLLTPLTPRDGGSVAVHLPNLQHECWLLTLSDLWNDSGEFCEGVENFVMHNPAVRENLRATPEKARLTLRQKLTDPAPSHITGINNRSPLVLQLTHQEILSDIDIGGVSRSGRLFDAALASEKANASPERENWMFCNRAGIQ